MIVSFIIPTFNSRSYIARCLDSVFSLGYGSDDFEVIIIDDASTDDTVDIVRRYAINHRCLRLVCSSENHRQGAARNLGLSIAQGDCVVFLDSDDEVDAGIKDAITRNSDEGLDMVAMRVVQITIEGEIEDLAQLPYKEDQIFSGVDLQTDFPFWHTASNGYVYNRSFLNKVNYRFAEEVIYEDSDFVSVHLYYAKKMAYCDSCCYRHHINATSTTHTFSTQHLADYAYLGARMLGFYEALPNKATKYADSILDGGWFCISESFRRLWRLGSGDEVRTFYTRLDSYCSRTQLLALKKARKYWRLWTGFCLRHRDMTVIIMGLASPVFKRMYDWWKRFSLK